MADRKDGFSSDDLLRQAWDDIRSDEVDSSSPVDASVEVDQVELPDIPDMGNAVRGDDPVDAFLSGTRSQQARSLPPAPPNRTRPSPPTPTRRSAPANPSAGRGPSLPTEPKTNSKRSRGLWIVVGVAAFGLLRLIGGSFSDVVSDDQSAASPAPVIVESPMVDFEDFASTEGVTLVASARAVDGAVSLTRKEEGARAGAVWSTDRVPVAGGFETLFVFEIDHVSWYTIGDGFAFVIQNTGTGVVGEVASGIGYKRIPNSVAVEFDTVYHDYEGDPLTPTDPEAPRLLANHVAVHTLGTEPNSSHARARIGYAGLTPVRLWDRRPHVALIRYVPGTLSIFVDNADDPVLVVDVDLEELLDLSNGTAHVGFTAATAGFYADHLIHRWHYGSPCVFVACTSP